MFEKITNRMREFLNTRTGFVLTVAAVAVAVAVTLRGLLNRDKSGGTQNV